MELSREAVRLLEYLRSTATVPADATTDDRTAGVLGIPARTIIDLADELLQAGYVVVARCQPPPGRWLLLPDASDKLWGEARAYVASLESRAKGIFGRAKHARQALAKMEAKRDVESTGQRRLF